MSTESSEVEELFNRIADCLPKATKYRGTVFRSAGVKYANETDFMSGEGASYYGGRWNQPGIKAIYASLDPVTAVHESYQEFIKYGFSLQDIKPRVMAGIELEVECLLDLSEASIRRKIGFSRKFLLEEPWDVIQAEGEESWTQAIGCGAIAAGFEGLIAPSARNAKGKNIVIYPEGLRVNSVLKVNKKEELPPHPRDWPS